MSTKDIPRAAWDGLSRIANRAWMTSEEKGWHAQEKAIAGLSMLLNSEGLKNSGVQFTPEALKNMKGFVEKFERTKFVQVFEKIMLVVTEAAEAAEVLRDKDSLVDLCYAVVDGKRIPYDDNVVDAEGRTLKPEGLGSELADVVIRVFDLAVSLQINLAEEIRRKMIYNEFRSHRHGGKLA